MEGYYYQQTQGSIFISFCNQGATPELSLCQFNILDKSVKWLDLSSLSVEALEGLGGVCGLVTDGKYLIIATQAHRPHLVVRDIKENKWICEIDLDGVVDAHSLVLYDNFIYVVSTGTNEVYRVSWDGRTVGVVERYWQYPGVNYTQDEVHLNGLTHDSGRFIASCFGKKLSEGHWGANGRIFYLSQPERSIHDGLSQPHSPLVVEDRLIFAESKSGQVYAYHKYEDQWALQKLIKLNGYVRGLACQGDILFAGISARRMVSRSRQTPLDESTGKMYSELLSIDLETESKQSLAPVASLGREIYELLPFCEQLEADTLEHCLTLRIQSFETTVQEQLVEIRNLQKEMFALSEEYGHVLKGYNKYKSKESKRLLIRLCIYLSKLSNRFKSPS